MWPATTGRLVARAARVASRCARLASGACIDHPAAVSDVPPSAVQEYAEQAVAYVRRALGMTLEYNSETLPVLDHYLRSVPPDQAATSAATELLAVTAGAYFGEVVRRLLGGRWELADEPKRWRLVLPAGISFAPAGLAAAAIARAELEDLDTAIDAPPRMKQVIEQALERMGDVSEDAYFSLSGRLDTLEHLHEVLVTVAAQMMGEIKDENEEGGEDEGEDEAAGDAAGAEGEKSSGGEGGGEAKRDEGSKGGASEQPASAPVAAPAKTDDGLN